MMHKPGTLPYIAEKWQAFTDDMTGHSAEICAWALEQEARYLRTVVDDGVQLGSELKYIFPVLRKAVFTLTVGQDVLTPNISQSVVREVVAESFKAVSEAAAELNKEPDEELTGNLLDNEVVIALADRLSGYIESFPG